jgi:hypothetical protein
MNQRPLVVTPADQTLDIDGATPATSTFVAVATHEDGSTEDVSDRAQFRLADATLGGFTANTFTSVDKGGAETFKYLLQPNLLLR